MFKHILLKLLNTKDKGTDLTVAREGRKIPYREIEMVITANISSENVLQRNQQGNTFKMLKYKQGHLAGSVRAHDS